MHLIFGLSRKPSNRISILRAIGWSLTVKLLLPWLTCFSFGISSQSSSMVTLMNDTILDYNLFFGAFVTMMNSWFICGPIFNEIYFWSSLVIGFSINQQLNSTSEFLMPVPSLYSNGSSSLLYWPKMVSQSYFFCFEIDNLTY